MKLIQYPDRKKIEENYNRALPAYLDILDTLQRELQQFLAGVSTHVTIKSRVKLLDSYYEKLLRRLSHEEQTGEMIPVHDILALRMVCPFLEDMSLVESIVRKTYAVREVEQKGAEHSFREFGYNTTHLVIEIPQRILAPYPDLGLDTFEIQIRTILQDAWAEVEHELVYKRRLTPLDEPLRRKLAALNANLTLSDIIFQEIRDYQFRLHDELKKRRHSFVAQLEKKEPGLILSEEASHESEKQEHEAGTLHSTNLDELLLNALHTHNQKEYARAIRIYNTLLGHTLPAPIRAIVFIHRGMAHFSMAHYPEALEDFRLATECQPDNSRAFYHVGVVYKVLGDKPGAIAALRKSVELNPYNFRALFGLAKTLFEAGEYAAALEQCEKALRLMPDSTQVAEFREMVLSYSKP